MEKIDINKIKLFYRDTPGTGKEVFASLGQEIPCVEFTMKGNVPQPITFTGQQHDQQHYMFSERWIQFEPALWTNMVEEVFEEMVKLWNEKHGEQPSLEDQSIRYCIDIHNDFAYDEVLKLPPSIIKAWEIGQWCQNKKHNDENIKK